MSENIKAIKYIFSGHDSFHCRQLWLKKGYDFVVEGSNFNDEDAVIKLGVGKNMVSSIRFWLKAFNVIDSKDIPTEFGIKMFDSNNGYDPYLEDEASLWLLHFQLVKNGYSSIYSFIFNEFRREKMFFDKDIFVNYIKRISDSHAEQNLNENTLAKDFNTFCNLYKHHADSKDNEDILNFNGLGKTNPVMAAVLTASLLSMAGIPIFSGFFAKFMLFTQTIQAGFLIVVIAGVINSIISVGYYFKLILAMYTKEPSEEKQSTPFVYYAVGIVSIVLNIIIGLYPSLVTDLIK